MNMWSFLPLARNALSSPPSSIGLKFLALPDTSEDLGLGSASRRIMVWYLCAAAIGEVLLLPGASPDVPRLELGQSTAMRLCTTWNAPVEVHRSMGVADIALSPLAAGISSFCWLGGFSRNTTTLVNQSNSSTMGDDQADQSTPSPAPGTSGPNPRPDQSAWEGFWFYFTWGLGFVTFPVTGLSRASGLSAWFSGHLAGGSAGSYNPLVLALRLAGWLTEELGSSALGPENWASVKTWAWVAAILASLAVFIYGLDLTIRPVVATGRRVLRAWLWIKEHILRIQHH